MLKSYRNNYKEIFTRAKTNPNAVPKAKLPLGQWFVNLPINSKHLTAMLVSELAIIFGLGISSTLIINCSLKAQYLKQAKSEISIADVNYNLKFTQMDFAFNGQSKNNAIIKAAQLYLLGQNLSQPSYSEVKQILQNEIQTLRIDSATLVGTDRRIIVNANSNRRGEFFDPHGLVSEVLKNPRQIQANVIVKRSDLEKEIPSLARNLNNQDALVRYTVTPVKSHKGNQVIGVLLAGDVVNGKQSITRRTLKATGEGYTAIYMNKGAGDFALATALNKTEGNDLNEATSNLDLPDKSILVRAVLDQGKVVTGQVAIGNQNYAIAAKAVPNKIIAEPSRDVPIFAGESVAILVQGSSQDNLQNLLQQNRLQYALASVFGLILIGVWTYTLKRRILKPIGEIEGKIRKFAGGDRSVRMEIDSTDELGQLAVAFNQMVETISEKAIQQENEAKLAQLVNKITFRIRGSLDTAQILNAAVTTMREAIQADRVVVYSFDENWMGKIVAECVGDEWPSALGTEIPDPCFARDYVDKYQRGRVQALENIYEAGLTACHIAQLEAFEVKANLVAPILLNNNLYGLLIAHQCDRPRKWKESEINLFKQVAIPIGYALEQAHILEQVHRARSRAELIAIEQSQQKEALQQQIIKLLRDIEGASKGDLTVRATITQGEIGTVADFFNTIVENLREIVTKVKASATAVNAALGENEGAIRQLADEAIKQAIDINHTLDSVERMTHSIADVADNAKKAAAIAHTASDTATEGEKAIDLTVEKIFNLRSTIDDTAKKVKRLGESSQQISRIVSLINEIAVQTNLLAVNAGLEASRVGEQSQGFAVVATEVGELAARCSDATQEIKLLVENIQRETAEVAKAMEQGTIQVVEGSRIVENAKISLNQILSVSRQIDELVQSISQATVSQVETSQAVTKLIAEISQVSESTSSSSRQISQSLQQTVRISQELQATVAKFKISEQNRLDV
ncbi:methyl-accepting chemotaxis protein [Fischerella sp. PCC 9605]|uniref:methyl-accepting chemotaxis protein n=1 Tax=Fischerella sp. PCC 9605 TaxID=1173024 RepID=UPI0004BB6A59|nr:methyl-accepting chemotaxis protein [Fischerella sp. PCC 9605]